MSAPRPLRLAGLAAVLVLATAAPAQAKLPAVAITISGGALARDVRLPHEVVALAEPGGGGPVLGLFVPTVPPAAGLPAGYRLTLQADRGEIARLAYWPAAPGRPAPARVESWSWGPLPAEWLRPSLRLAELLDGRIRWGRSAVTAALAEAAGRVAALPRQPWWWPGTLLAAGCAATTLVWVLRRGATLRSGATAVLAVMTAAVVAWGVAEAVHGILAPPGLELAPPWTLWPVSGTLLFAAVLLAVDGALRWARSRGRRLLSP